jgi:hypothetical protein
MWYVVNYTNKYDDDTGVFETGSVDCKQNTLERDFPHVSCIRMFNETILN